jgi:hypothetical protein
VSAAGAHTHAHTHTRTHTYTRGRTPTRPPRHVLAGVRAPTHADTQQGLDGHKCHEGTQGLFLMESQQTAVHTGHRHEQEPHTTYCHMSSQCRQMRRATLTYMHVPHMFLQNIDTHDHTTIYTLSHSGYTMTHQHTATPKYLGRQLWQPRHGDTDTWEPPYKGHKVSLYIHTHTHTHTHTRYTLSWPDIPQT